jgi:hypothetical protein
MVLSFRTTTPWLLAMHRAAAGKGGGRLALRLAWISSCPADCYGSLLEAVKTARSYRLVDECCRPVPAKFRLGLFESHRS